MKTQPEGGHSVPPEPGSSEVPSVSRSYLVQPKGPGTGYQLRLRTPAALIGTPDPATGKPFGPEIRRGLGTRDLRQAGARAAILRGQVLALVESIRRPAGVPSLTTERALGWATAIAEQDARGGPSDHEPDYRDLVREEASRARSVSPSRAQAVPPHRRQGGALERAA